MSDERTSQMQNLSTADHDLLIELRTEVKGMRADIKSLADDTKDRLTRVEESKLDKQEFSAFIADDKTDKKDKETRLRFLERWFWVAWGAVTITEFGIICYLTFFHH